MASSTRSAQPDAQPPVRRKALSRDAIIEAALDIARAGRLEDVGMVSVATALDVTPMALYRHVGDKQSLMRLVVDAAHRTIELPDPSAGDWAVRLRILVNDMRSVYRAFPGLAEYSASHGPALRTEHTMPVSDWCLQLLLDAGVQADEIGVVYPAVRNLFFVGLLHSGAPETDPGPVDPAKFPALARLLPAMKDVTDEQQFEFLFDLYIDWIERHLPARRTASKGRHTPSRAR